MSNTLHIIAEAHAAKQERDRLNAARAEAVLEYASQKDALVGGPHEGAHWANALAYVKAQGWLTQGPQEAPTACTDCPRCGDHVRTSDLRQWQVCEQTHMEPAEYEDGCINCCPREEQ